MYNYFSFYSLKSDEALAQWLQQEEDVDLTFQKIGLEPNTTQQEFNTQDTKPFTIYRKPQHSAPGTVREANVIKAEKRKAAETEREGVGTRNKKSSGTRYYSLSRFSKPKVQPVNLQDIMDEEMAKQKRQA
jgi:hypothetical protein